MQSAFDDVQSHLTQIKLVLNSDKFKFKLFSSGKELLCKLPKNKTSQGIEVRNAQMSWGRKIISLVVTVIQADPIIFVV